MAGITTRITLFVMVACLLIGLISNLNILPDVNTVPGWDDNQEAFQNVANPVTTSSLDFVTGAVEMAFTAITVFVKSLITCVFIIPILTQYGLDWQYVVMIQSLLWGLYGYDAIAIWKGWDPI